MTTEIKLQHTYRLYVDVSLETAEDRARFLERWESESDIRHEWNVARNLQAPDAPGRNDAGVKVFLNVAEQMAADVIQGMPLWCRSYGVELLDDAPNPMPQALPGHCCECGQDLAALPDGDRRPVGDNAEMCRACWQRVFENAYAICVA